MAALSPSSGAFDVGIVTPQNALLVIKGITISFLNTIPYSIELMVTYLTVYCRVSNNKTIEPGILLHTSTDNTLA